MSWVVLVVSGVFESVWAIALDHSEGFTKPIPVVVFLVALVVSMGGLSYAMRDIGVGTSYAVWVGIGATITVCYSMITGAESFSWAKMLLILGLVGCVIGLKVVSMSHGPVEKFAPRRLVKRISQPLNSWSC